MTKIVINKDGTKYKLLSDALYTVDNKLLAKMKETGNGFIFKFPSWTSSNQDNYVCLDYSEAEYMRELLNAQHANYTTNSSSN
jgi:hypothetical protein